MTKNSGPKPKFSTQGQAAGPGPGKGGYNQKAKPFGMKAGSNNHSGHASPQFGSSGQRLAGGGGKGATGYPPGYCGK
jgi:hypothetical protein